MFKFFVKAYLVQCTEIFKDNTSEIYHNLKLENFVKCYSDIPSLLYSCFKCSKMSKPASNFIENL